MNEVTKKPVVDCIIVDDRIGTKWKFPEYKTQGSAGIDLLACLDEELTLQPGEVKLIPSGMKIYVEDPNLVGLLMPRSGLGHKNGIILGNSTGVIDSDYQGETKISCWNRSGEPFTISPGDRICQMLFVPITQVELNIVDSFEESDRGEGGFGSTGK